MSSGQGLPVSARLNHRQLEAFRTLIQTGTVTAAAGLLSISQPAVSRLIGDLESVLGFTLFIRHKGRLTPTQEARALAREVELSFVGLEAIRQAAKDLREFRTGSLKIATMPALALSYLPHLAHRFLDSHPGVTLDLQVFPSETVAHRVATQRVDVGFAVHWRTDPAIMSEVLAAAPLMAVLPRDFPLPADGVIRPQTLEGAPFVSLDLGLQARFLIDQAFFSAKVSRRLMVETSLSHVACDLVAAGAGVSLVDPLTALSFQDKGLRVLPFSPAIRFEYHVLRPAQVPPALLTQRFVAYLKDEIVRILGTSRRD
jgi:DNA-binding transcriptional LysR family regulator